MIHSLCFNWVSLIFLISTFFVDCGSWAMKIVNIWVRTKSSKTNLGESVRDENLSQKNSKILEKTQKWHQKWFGRREKNTMGLVSLNCSIHVAFLGSFPLGQSKTSKNLVEFKLGSDFLVRFFYREIGQYYCVVTHPTHSQISTYVTPHKPQNL